MVRAMHKDFLACTAALALGLSLCPAASAQRSMPQPVPIIAAVPDAVDTPYPGVISLNVDATDITHAVFRVTEKVPVAAGTTSLILQLPEWLPGNHAATGPIEQLNDVKFYADGKLLRWWRDPVEVYAFHIDVPAGASEVTAKFVNTSPVQGGGEGRVTTTREMLNLQWDAVSLYPAGHFVRQIRIKPTVLFPAGWGVASALDGKVQDGARVTWGETDYELLVDSPVFAGVNFKRFDLGNNVAMNIVADKAEQLAIKPENMAVYHSLVDEALLAFGAHHFDHYDFLLALTDRMGGIGLEHHRSSENSMDPNSLTKWAEYDWDRNVVAHEFSHSWDGKFRRPAKLWTPDYRTPMQDNLLWVYEGQTQFWGLVLAARSGVQSKDVVLGELANYAGQFSQMPGRVWRSVEDTTHDEIMDHRRPRSFSTISRNEDYYTEGALIWLEADQVIRAGTRGNKGIDDFAKAFFGIKNGDYGEVTYDFDEVVRTLNGVYPYDWASFLHTRIMEPNQPNAIAGIEKAGYSLVFKEEPNPFDKARMADAKGLSLYNSLGIAIDKDGKITSSRWDSAGFNAGLVPGGMILAVNGLTYDADGIKAAITAAKGNDKPIDLVVQRGDKVMNISVAYHDGLRWPWLERTGSAKGPVGLDLLLAPRRPGAK